MALILLWSSGDLARKWLEKQDLITSQKTDLKHPIVSCTFILSLVWSIVDYAVTSAYEPWSLLYLWFPFVLNLISHIIIPWFTENIDEDIAELKHYVYRCKTV